MPRSLKNLRNMFAIRLIPVCRGCRFWQRLLAVLAITFGLTLASTGAQELDPTGILDQLPASPSKGSATQSTLSAQEAAALSDQRQALVRAEHAKFKQLPENELSRLAENGVRGAQLVLAEQFSDEAVESIALISANAAMSDAAYWYARAARRGVPGAINVDGAIPLFPLRAVRGD